MANFHSSGEQQQQQQQPNKVYETHYRKIRTAVELKNRLEEEF